MRRVPGELRALLCAALALALAWALLVPPAQVPDEPVHVAYVQTLVERGEQPRLKADEGSDRDVYSTEQKLARQRSAYEAAIHEPSVRPEWRPSEFERWREQESELGGDARRDGGVGNPAAGNPPLYYLWEAIPYALTYPADLFTRWYAMRAWSALLIGLSALATWLLAGELFRRDRGAQLVAAGFVALHPGVSAISAGVNPDGAMVAAWALVMWLGVRLLRRDWGDTRHGCRRLALDVGALLAATLAALMIKATSFGLLPAVGLALAITLRRYVRAQALWQHGRGGRRAAAWAGLVAGAGVTIALIVLSGAGDRLRRLGTGEGDVSLRGFASYLWQAYLPNLPFQTPVRNLAAFWGYDVWVRSAWGNFGWDELLLPNAAYAAIAAGCAVLGAGALLALVRRRLRIEPAPAVFLLTVVAALVLGLHFAEYRQFLDSHLSLLQGRYLLVLAPLGGVVAAAALRNLRPGARLLGAAALLVALYALQVFSLGVVIGRFYA